MSDHFHPWIDAQGESPFVWSVLGAIAQATERIRVGTGVTCPIMRVHPAILAQAAATTQCMFDGRFWFGVGSGEALNEHIARDEVARDERPARDARGSGGGDPRACGPASRCSHYGEYFAVENARIYTLPARRRRSSCRRSARSRWARGSHRRRPGVHQARRGICSRRTSPRVGQARSSRR